MSKSRKRFIVSLTVITLIGVLVWILAPHFRQANQGVSLGNQANEKIKKLEIEIRATSASSSHSVRIDAYDYSADVHFGDDVIQVNRFQVNLPGGLLTVIPDGCRLVEIRQLNEGFQIRVDGVEFVAGISEKSKKSKAADLKTFDELRNGLENAELFDLISLKQEESAVLGETRINDRAIRKKFLDALRKSIVDFDHAHTVLCFDPRHAIYTKQNGIVRKLVICFECAQVEAWSGMKFQVSETAQPIFDQVLREAGVPLPEPSKK